MPFLLFYVWQSCPVQGVMTQDMDATHFPMMATLLFAVDCDKDWDVREFAPFFVTVKPKME